MPALFPDVALIHVQKADRLGNCQIDGYPHMDADIARAAATVLVTAEEIVSEDEIRLHPDRTVLPGFLVDALAHVPYGSYPHECYGVYDAEPDHFTDLRGRHPRARRRGRGRLSGALRLRARRATRTTWPSSASRAGRTRRPAPGC